MTPRHITPPYQTDGETIWVGDRQTGVGYYLIAAPKDFPEPPWWPDQTAAATAKRMVECSNACEGINPVAVTKLFSACEGAVRMIARARARLTGDEDPREPTIQVIVEDEIIQIYRATYEALRAARKNEALDGLPAPWETDQDAVASFIDARMSTESQEPRLATKQENRNVEKP